MGKCYIIPDMILCSSFTHTLWVILLIDYPGRDGSSHLKLEEKRGRKSEIRGVFYLLKCRSWRSLIQIGSCQVGSGILGKTLTSFKELYIGLRKKKQTNMAFTGFCCLGTLMGALLWYLRAYSPATKIQLCKRWYAVVTSNSREPGFSDPTTSSSPYFFVFLLQ